MKKKQKSSSRESRQEKAKFKRRWGVTREIYDKMICVLADWEAQNKDTRGSKAGLTIEQKVQVARSNVKCNRFIRIKVRRIKLCLAIRMIKIYLVGG